MKKWSRLTAVILTICMVLALAACGAKDTNEGSEDKNREINKNPGGILTGTFFSVFPSHTLSIKDF